MVSKGFNGDPILILGMDDVKIIVEAMLLEFDDDYRVLDKLTKFLEEARAEQSTRGTG